MRQKNFEEQMHCAKAGIKGFDLQSRAIKEEAADM